MVCIENNIIGLCYETITNNFTVVMHAHAHAAKIGGSFNQKFSYIEKTDGYLSCMCHLYIVTQDVNV